MVDIPDIPPNDPSHPRWLLDLDEWVIRDYKEIEHEVVRDGYGIISYTWGRWASWEQVPPDVPKGLQWPVPLVKDLPLGLAKEVVSAMGLRYVWWDWMCVPQVKEMQEMTPLLEKLLEAKGQEVGKQMYAVLYFALLPFLSIWQNHTDFSYVLRVIYKGAKRSIVWLHCTRWGTDSPIETLLKDKLPKQNLPEYLDDVDDLLCKIQKDEPWLTSGWTLQEGVLLSETILLDHEGMTLRDERFLHSQGQASVIDLTAGLTTFAIRIAKAFMTFSEPNDDGHYDVVVQYIHVSDQNYYRVAHFLSHLLRSSLIAYTKKTPLYILAGKFSRKYSAEEDQCWELLGALDLGGFTPWYEEKPDMDRVKSVFFMNLLQEHQWSMLLVAAERGIYQKYSPLPWHIKVINGYYLPLGIVNWKPNLPALSWSHPVPRKSQNDAIHIQTSTGAAFTLLRVRKDGTALCRTYTQYPDRDDKGWIEISSVVRVIPSSSLYFPIADLESTSNMPGARCIEIIPTKEGTQPAPTGRFNGVIGIWATEGSLEEIQFTKFSMLSGA